MNGRKLWTMFIDVDINFKRNIYIPSRSVNQGRLSDSFASAHFIYSVDGDVCWGDGCECYEGGGADGSTCYWEMIKAERHVFMSKSLKLTKNLQEQQTKLLYLSLVSFGKNWKVSEFSKKVAKLKTLVTSSESSNTFCAVIYYQWTTDTIENILLKRANWWDHM